MRNYKTVFMCFLAALLVTLAAGCGQETVTIPGVVSVTPAQSATGVAATTTVTATFNMAMSPASISTTTFTLVAPGGVAVAGAVTYSGKVATFTPTNALLSGDTYTATITTGAATAGGAELLGNYVWTFLVGAPRNLTPPELVSTVPGDTAPGVEATGVPLNEAISATFSEAMNPLNLTTSTFLLYSGTEASGTAIAGQVTYDQVNFIATFTPTDPLTASTFYTATVTAAATDMNGNPLGTAVPSPYTNPWTFETGTAAAPAPVTLGPTISLFGGFGGAAGMTNQGTSTVVNGDIGTTGASTLVTGFHDTSLPIAGAVWPCTYTQTPLNTGQVNGTIDTGLPPPTVDCPLEGTAATLAIATEALSEAQTAYITLKGLPSTGVLAAELGGTTIYPGVYTNASTVGITSGDLTLNAQGNPNAYWVFQVGSSLTVGEAAVPRNVILTGGAKASNIFWAVGTGTTINGAGGGTMEGTIISGAGISVSTAGVAAVTTINGRLIALTASTTLVNTVINVPAQ
jgi:ice-binding like protein/Big-like domain-containing protein